MGQSKTNLPNIPQEQIVGQGNNSQDDLISHEIAAISLTGNNESSTRVTTSLRILPSPSNIDGGRDQSCLIVISKPPPLIICSQPKASSSRKSNLLIKSATNTVTLNNINNPQSLFVQALGKLNDHSLGITIINNTTFMENNSGLLAEDKVQKDVQPKELSPPDSLTSAPPSYSFVLRQMALRRRPRLVGTFIPSPSFVQHAPPPNYAAAFDVYIDSRVPATSHRIYNYGFTPMPVICPECGFPGMTMISTRITICTHLCAGLLCLFCCWICAPLPYLLRSCKDVYHYCRNCRNFLGMYCPTNPDNNMARRETPTVS